MKKILLVGGAVRDSLLGLEPKDKDFLAVGYNSSELLLMGFKQVGKDFPVFLHPETGEEYALPRKERSTGDRYTDFTFETEGVSVEEDLSRRDLTINAMAMDLDGSLIDPFGGEKDLNMGVLRHTTEAFKEDPLRVLRIARFRARFPSFSVAKETAEMVKEMKPMLYALTKERVFKELEKAMGENEPHMFFLTLLELGVLDAVFPSIYKWTKVEHNNVHHMEGSVFNHSMLVLKKISELSEEKEIRFAALFHDIGKVPSFKEFGNFNSHSKEEVVMNEVAKLSETLRLPKVLRKVIRQSALFHHKIHNFMELKATTIVKMFFNKHFPKTEEELETLLLVSKADSFGRWVLEEGDKKRILDIYEALFYTDSKFFSKGERAYKTVYKNGEYVSGTSYYETVKKAFKAFKAVSVKDLNGESVEKIKETLYLRRVSAVKKVL